LTFQDSLSESLRAPARLKCQGFVSRLNISSLFSILNSQFWFSSKQVGERKSL